MSGMCPCAPECRTVPLKPGVFSCVSIKLFFVYPPTYTHTHALSLSGRSKKAYLNIARGGSQQSSTRCRRATFLRLPRNYPLVTRRQLVPVFLWPKKGENGQRGERRSGDAFHSVFYDLSLAAPIVAGQGEKEKGQQLRRPAFRFSQSPLQSVLTEDNMAGITIGGRTLLSTFTLSPREIYYIILGLLVFVSIFVN